MLRGLAYKGQAGLVMIKLMEKPVTDCCTLPSALRKEKSTLGLQLHGVLAGH